MTFQPLRGFRDYLPPEAGTRSELRRRMREAARRCGFSELETPSVESLELFRAKSGEQLSQQLWSFEDKNHRAVTLVAETTPSLARVFVDRAKSEPLPVKWFTVSRLWRYEEPQQGRTREFTQFNFDILGVPGVAAEAEVLAAASLALDAVGAQGCYAFRLNDRGVIEGLGRLFGATDLPRLLNVLDGLAKVPAAQLDRDLAAAGLSPDGIARLREVLASAGTGVPLADAESWLARLEATGMDEAGRAGVSRLRDLSRLLVGLGLGDRVVLDPTVVRGLAYYTTTVFEAFDRVGDGRSLFGGGRYDRLVELFGGPPTPACGLAIGDQTLELLLKGHGRWPEGEPALDTYVIAVTPAEVPTALAWVQRLRRAGRSADADLMGRSMSRQLREAARRRARRALILGPKERERGVVLERDLTTGDQRERPVDEALPPG